MRIKSIETKLAAGAMSVLLAMGMMGCGSANSTAKAPSGETLSANAITIEDDAVPLAASASGQKSTLMSKFPVIDYPRTGTGRGPGANYRKGIDYNNFFVTRRHTLGESNWWELTTWTASNGVVLKALPADQGYPYGVIPIMDGCGIDNKPASDYLLAVGECMGWADYWGNGTDLRQKMTEVPAVQIPAASVNRTSIDVNDPALLSFKGSYEAIMNSAGGIDGDFFVEPNLVMHRDISGATVWKVQYDPGMGAWRVDIFPSFEFKFQYAWDGIKNILKYVDPDGEALYNVIFEDYYVGSESIPEFDSWWPVANSQIYQPDYSNMNYCEYFIN